MPELLMERPKMSLQMHETLKRYILRERRKKKEEDVAIEQKMQEELVNWTNFILSIISMMKCKIFHFDLIRKKLK